MKAFGDDLQQIKKIPENNTQTGDHTRIIKKKKKSCDKTDKTLQHQQSWKSY